MTQPHRVLCVRAVLDGCPGNQHQQLIQTGFHKLHIPAVHEQDRAQQLVQKTARAVAVLPGHALQQHMLLFKRIGRRRFLLLKLQDIGSDLPLQLL